MPDGYLSEDEGMDSDDEKSKRAVKKEEGEGGDADTGMYFLLPLHSSSTLFPFSPPILFASY